MGVSKIKLAPGQVLFVNDVFKQIIRIKDTGSSTFDFSYDILAGDKNWKHFSLNKVKDPSDAKREVIVVLMEGIRKD